MAEPLTPPHSVEAEQAVLGGLLIDPPAWDQVGDMVVADDFYRPDHRLIFTAFAELVTQSKPADVVTTAEQLERHGRLADAGGLAYLGTLARDTPTAANVRAYAQIVRERSLLRKLIHAGREITSAALASDGRSARDLVDEAEQQVFAIAEQSTGRREGAVRVSVLLPPLIDRIDEWHTNPNTLRGLATGFTDFDRKTGGLRPGDLVIVAGRPSMGKTTLAMNIAEYAAVHPGTKASVAIFSMEMPSEQLLTRMLSSIGGVPLNGIRSGQISDEDWVRVTAATSQLSEARIFVDESPGLTPTELRARARRVKREHGLDLVVIDYLQLMQVPGTKENRATEIAEISRGLKALAKELAVPVIALSQLNRGVEQRTEKKPVMSDLRECVTGDTLVCLTDGRRLPIRDLVGTTPEVWSVDEQQRVVAARSDKVWRVSRKPVFRVQVASGRSIRATANHRMLVGEGWTTVSNLKSEDYLLSVLATSTQQIVASAASGLHSDRIVSILPDGEEDVFDLTVPGPANWLADGLVTHNSGAIEQDADMILLIYREEVYDKNTTKRGIAEIDLAKHRNGEIGTFLLTFQGQYSRFSNYASDAYAEGVLR